MDQPLLEASSVVQDVAQGRGAPFRIVKTISIFAQRVGRLEGMRSRWNTKRATPKKEVVDFGVYLFIM